MSRCFTFFALAVALPLCWWPPTHAAAPGPLPPEVARAFEHIRPDPPPAQINNDKHYVVSNERRLHLFREPALDRGGVFVGVGTDQNYVFAGWARPEILVLMDFDEEVVRLHAAYRAFFLTAPTAAEFVDLWTKARRRDARAAIKQHIGGALKYRAIKVYGRNRGYVLKRMKELRRRLGDAKTPFFLSDPEQYRYLVELFRHGRVFALRGDLRGRKTFAGIRDAVRAAGSVVRVLYLSNAEQYLMYRKGFRANMLDLPSDERSVILRTLPGRPAGFEYLIQSAADFKAWLRRKGTGSVYRMRGFKKGMHLVAGNVHRLGPPP